MKAAVLKAFGGPENLEFGEVPDPVPGPGEVLLRVRACALNHLDLWIREGLPSAKVKLPFILGCDAAGEAAALGPDVEGVELGARFAVHPGRCCGRCAACLDGRESDCPDYGIIGAYGGRPGAYAELLAVPVADLLPMSAAQTFAQAAAAPLTFLTAWHMLETLAELRSGETLLVMGAGAGVATAAIQIAKRRGARVIAVSTSKEKLERAKSLGADFAIQNPPEDLARTVRKLTGGGMADAVFEHIGGSFIGEALKCLRRSGRLVTCGATAGPVAPIDLRYVFDRQLRILGAKMGGRAEMRAVWERLAAGEFAAVVDRTFPLAQARAAHEYLAARGQFGKVVLLP
ncbi:MAG TPA: zinc-binding dehydrogenase [Elusimicrobiota bacterium]|nr:zinc-binding dehydrogenase [Elusimicrobiota bacterium]